ncbi:MAG: diacylglycerol kinase family lipid kinase [Anaerolineales bacterium]|nr:diacylglycerol kinase family lipid kinase [Anaerolineales bacterium]MCX7609839.1 diacylglycerol kinase family lipid kinase [Anaerolineales bacterium]MDW8226494.1 diacylglycerol kinase family lipid kinase [Anaerolineales bacterium]
MTAKVILNPYSNRWNAQKRWPQAEAALKRAGIEFSLAISPAPHKVVDLAEEAARQGFRPIIAAGGDGTIGEVVNGIARVAASEQAELGPIGVLPLGTANDLAHNIGIPLDLDAAARVIASGATRRLDVCRVNDLYFVNNSALGMEPYVTLIQQRITWISGPVRYLVAAIRGVLDYPVWTASIEWDSGSYEGPISLLTVGNGARTGGFYMTPHADPFDGKLTFVYGFGASRWRLLQLLPDALKPGAGNYVEAPEIHEETATWIRVRLIEPSPAHADGEIFALEAKEFVYSIQPARLKIFLPA